MKAKEVFTEKRSNGNCKFLCASGELQQAFGTSSSTTRLQKNFISDGDNDEEANDSSEVVMEEGYDDSKQEHSLSSNPVDASTRAGGRQWTRRSIQGTCRTAVPSRCLSKTWRATTMSL